MRCHHRITLGHDHEDRAVTLTFVFTAVIFMAAIFLAACGMLMLKRGEAALETLSHTRASLVQAFAGRYFAMSSMLMALAIYREWRALGIVLLIGGLMGCLDFYVVGKAGGKVAPHAVASFACFALAVGAFAIARA